MKFITNFLHIFFLWYQMGCTGGESGTGRAFSEKNITH